MSTQYTIYVQNNRGARTSYAVSMEPPQFTGGQEHWMNVWYRSSVPEDGSFEIRTGTDFYAWVGTLGIRPEPGVVIRGGMSLPSHLGSESTPGSTFDLKIIESSATITETSPTAIPGSYEIDTGTDFEMPNETHLIGLAKDNDQGRIGPVASMLPLNNMKIQISPKMKFYVWEGQETPGEVVDYSSVVRKGATIDFSSGEGLGKFSAIVIHGMDGKFTVTYH